MCTNAASAMSCAERATGTVCSKPALPEVLVYAAGLVFRVMVTRLVVRLEMTYVPLEVCCFAPCNFYRGIVMLISLSGGLKGWPTLLTFQYF